MRDPTVVRNNLRRWHFNVRHLQTWADSGVMGPCCSWRERWPEWPQTS